MSRLPLILLAVGLAAAALRAQGGAPCGRMLYQRHCAQCHGLQGRGDGDLAKLLEPPPRDFSTARFQLVSTANGVPTVEDIAATLERGMPGSGMPSFRHLPPEWRMRLAGYVLALSRSLFTADLAAALAEEGEEGSELQASLAEAVAVRFEPGPVLHPPADTGGDGLDVRRLYERNCADCHGAEGRGDGTREMRDEQGRPARPRDLRGGIFQGGGDTEALYRRIVLGMPGSAMPAAGDLTPAGALRLAEFVRDLAGRPVLPPAPPVVSISWLEPLPSAAADWQAVPVVSLPLQPLDWRHDPGMSADLQLARSDDELLLRVEWALPEWAGQDGPALAALAFCNYEDPPYFRTFHGGAFDFVRLRARAVGGRLSAEFRRPLEPSDSVTVDLHPQASPRQLQLMLILPTAEGPALSFSPWLRLDH